MISWYRRIFSIQEIEENKTLWWVFGATLFSYALAFHGWLYDRMTTLDAYNDGSYICWPYFQHCDALYMLRTLPEGYSQSFLYMVFFGLMVLSVYFMYRKDWIKAHMALMPVFLWHGFVAFILTYGIAGNYDHYLFVFACILLLLPHKEFFLKGAVILFYFLAATIKIHEGWVLGTYFSALKTGLPLFPEWSIPVWTNAVIFMQIVGSWFLVSSRPFLQRAALTYFILFHLYSGMLVGYRYPATVLPTLLILFGPMYRVIPVPFDRRSLAGWALVIALGISQSIAFIIPGDVKLTLEGNKYGLYMFEANHQCISMVKISYTDGTTQNIERESESSRRRCDPYAYWFRINVACDRDQEVTSIAWTFDHSINGGPFLRIVDEVNACDVTYRPFSHNEWIKTLEDEPSVIGYPVENVYD